MMDYAAMGSRIRARRQELGLTQEQLAELVHVSTSFTGHVERGSRKGSLETFANIGQAMGMSLDAIVGAPYVTPADLDCTQKDLGRARELLKLMVEMIKPLSHEG